MNIEVAKKLTPFQLALLEGLKKLREAIQSLKED
jgi:hypothetical protein